MLARNVSIFDLQQAANSIGAHLNEPRQIGNTVRFTIRPDADCEWRRTSASAYRQGRRVNAVCWHGHRNFFRALFTACPKAIVTTAWLGKTTYTAENFEIVYPKTNVNVGSRMFPVYACEACDCPDSGYGK